MGASFAAADGFAGETAAAGGSPALQGGTRRSRAIDEIAAPEIKARGIGRHWAAVGKNGHLSDFGLLVRAHEDVDSTVFMIGPQFPVCCRPTFG